MGRITEFRRKLGGLIHRDSFDRDLEEEMRQHVEMQTEENRENGMPGEEARYAARRQFGNAAALKERSRDAWGWGALERFGQDLKHAASRLRANPGFTAAALLTLTASIGANSVVYSVVRAVVLAPLPYREPGRLTMIYGSRPKWGDRAMIAGPNLLDIRAQSTAFEDSAIAGYHSADLTGAGEPEHVEGCRATVNLFSVLGAQPSVGRGFAPADALDASPPVVVLSDALWRRRFGGDPLAIGKSIALGKQTPTIVGIMPPWFHFPNEQTDYWIPLPPSALTANRGFTVFRSVARLKPAATVEQANAELGAISARLAGAYPGENAGWRWHATPIAASVSGGVRPTLLILMGAVGMVLLIACANVANLLLARGVERQREMAVRAALGASRRRLARLLFTESLFLSACGGVLGSILAMWGVRALRPFYPPDLPRAGEIQVNAPVLVFTLLLTTAAALAAGLLPAIRLSRTDLNAAMKSGAQSSGFRAGRARGALVVAQVGLAVVLMTCASLLVKSFLLETYASGFNPDNVLTVELSSGAPADIPSLTQGIRAVPGVVAVAATTSLAYQPIMSFKVSIAGQAMQPREVFFDVVTPDIFRVLGVPLRGGRAFHDADQNASGPPVAIVNETMARRWFPGEDPVGRQILMGSTPRTIVGVAGDMSVGGETEAAMYLPYLQFDYRPDILVIRTAAPPGRLAATVRGAIHAIEPKTPILRMETIPQNVSKLVARQRFSTLLLGLFAALALGLAALGVCGVVGSAVSARTHEIGMRMALGATAGQVLWAVMRGGALMAMAGGAMGVAASLGATRLLDTAGLLYRIRPADPLAFAFALLVLIAATLAGCYVPARRATRIDPMEALRHD